VGGGEAVTIRVLDAVRHGPLGGVAFERGDSAVHVRRAGRDHSLMNASSAVGAGAVASAGEGGNSGIGARVAKVPGWRWGGADDGGNFDGVLPGAGRVCDGCWADCGVELAIFEGFQPPFEHWVTEHMCLHA